MSEEKKEIIQDIEKVVNEESQVTKEIEKNIESLPITKDEFEIREERLIKFIRKKIDWIYYIILAFIVIFSVYIRTLNISKLKDITTNTWTLGPDLDPFLFLRWAKYIVENGTLMTNDVIRYIPVGYNTAGEMKLLSYMIAWFHNFLSFFYDQATVTYSAILFPAVMFGLTIIAFFLFAREIFYKENKRKRNIIALIATLFFAMMPSLLPRTIAGIPEKESVAFFFMFMAFYFFLKGFESKNLKKGIIFGILSGAATAGMALTWGGVIFIFFTIPISFLIAFILGVIKKEEFFVYSAWLLSSFSLMTPFSTRYIIKNLIMSSSTGSALVILVAVGISLIILKTEKLEKLRKRTKLPKESFYLLVSLLSLIIIIIITLGPKFIISEISHIKNDLITPMQNRFGLTVAENKQPYFQNDWKDSFGPIYFNIPLYFWLFFIGSIVLFNNLITKLNNREKVLLTFSYFIFLFFLIFSRYSPNGKLNGVSGLSLLLYFGGIIYFLGTFAYFYYKRYHEGDFSIFKEFNFSYILYFFILTLGIIGARGGIRLIMVLGAVSPIAVSFLIFRVSEKFLKEKEETMKFFMGILAILIILASLFTIQTYYK